MPRPATTLSRPSVHHGLDFYPAYCHSVSPTWNTWVKLTCYDIHHTLQPRAGSSDFGFGHDSLVLYYLNHPVQYVQIVGIIITCQADHERLWLFRVDDSSGDTVEVTCPKPRLKNGTSSARTHTEQKDGVKIQKTKAKDSQAEVNAEDVALQLTLAKLGVGTVVQAKGTLSTFRGIRQLSLKRIRIVPDTNAEMLLVDARTKAVNEVLSRPWTVSAGCQKRLLRDAQAEKDGANNRVASRRAREAKKQQREIRHAARIVAEYQKEEAIREAEAAEACRAGLQLQRTSEQLIHS